MHACKKINVRCIFLQICSKFELLISQGSAATYQGVVADTTSHCSKFHVLSSSEIILKIG